MKIDHYVGKGKNCAYLDIDGNNTMAIHKTGHTLYITVYTKHEPIEKIILSHGNPEKVEIINYEEV